MSPTRHTPMHAPCHACTPPVYENITLPQTSFAGGNTIVLCLLYLSCPREVSDVLQVSRCVLEPPVLPADLFVLSPGYEVPPDLATVPPPLSMRGLRSWCPWCCFECSKWHCWHCDVKRIIFSCRKDVMNPYKRSCPDRDAVLWLPTTNWTVSCICPTVCSPGTIPEVPTVFLVK